MKSDKTPEDSVLKRHHDSQAKMTGGTGTRSTHTASSSKGAASSGESGSSSSGGGILGWLKRLFR